MMSTWWGSSARHGTRREERRASRERRARRGADFRLLRAAMSNPLASTPTGRVLPWPTLFPMEYERSPRVLVVEDDDAIAQVLQRSLRMAGYEVKLAADGVIALDEAHSFLPD